MMQPAAATQHLLRPRPYPSMFSLVVPMFNEEAVLAAFRAGIGHFLDELKCPAEVIVCLLYTSDAADE